MNTPEGQVVALGQGSATVSVDAAVACARCAAGRGCGAGLFQEGRKRLIEVNVVQGLSLEIGDRVRLEQAPGQLLRAAWLAYGLPLVSMLVAVAVAAAIVESSDELAAVLFGAAGLLAGAWTGRRILHRNACLRRIVPTACERIVSTTADRPDPGPLRRTAES